MKTTSQYALVGAVIVIAIIIIYFLVAKPDAQAQSLTSPIVTTLPAMMPNMPYTISCGMIQDESGVVRQKMILLDARSGKTWALIDSTTGLRWTAVSGQ